jgi:hypothetical protein
VVNHLDKGSLDDWSQKHTEKTKEHFSGMKKEISTLVDVIEDSIVQDFIKKRAINEEPLQEIQDAYEKTYPL